MQPLWVYAAGGEGDAVAPRLGRTLRTGVGKTAAAIALTESVLDERPDFVLLFGVCGAFPDGHGPNGGVLQVGELCIVLEDVMGDEGVESPAGFVDLAGMGLGTVGPFVGEQGLVARLGPQLRAVPQVRGVTVSTCSGTDARSRSVASRSAAAVETMEGAAVAAVCGRFELPWVQVRCVSNRTGNRDAGGFDIPGAIAKLHEALAVARPHVVSTAP